jgi:signal transduction histidine kinase
MTESNNKFTILVVDDIPENIDILRGILNSKYNIKAAINGRTALAIAASDNPPDLILLDVVMPEMDGFEVCRKLRETRESFELPVIFLTSETETENVITGFKIGGQDYIAKPFKPEELLSRVETHLELKKKTEQLNLLNKTLEKKVSERTAQLDESNKGLVKANFKLEKAYSDLRNLDMAKTKFLKIISHEIRTPLNGIAGMTNLLEDTLESHESLEFLKYLKISVERLNKFSKKALQITELQTENTDITKEKIDVQMLIEEIIEDFQETIGQKNISINTDFSTGFQITADRHLLKICLGNIIENAVSYTEKDGAVFLNAFKEENVTAIRIINNGKAFSQEDLDNMFSFFYIGRDPVDKDFGLGLATSKLIMDAHMGEIKVENIPEIGPSVTLFLPEHQDIEGKFSLLTSD